MVGVAFGQLVVTQPARHFGVAGACDEQAADLGWGDELELLHAASAGDDGGVYGDCLGGAVNPMCDRNRSRIEHHCSDGRTEFVVSFAGGRGEEPAKSPNWVIYTTHTRRYKRLRRDRSRSSFDRGKTQKARQAVAGRMKPETAALTPELGHE